MSSQHMVHTDAPGHAGGVQRSGTPAFSCTANSSALARHAGVRGASQFPRILPVRRAGVREMRPMSQAEEQRPLRACMEHAQ